MYILEIKNLGKKFKGSAEWAVSEFNLEVNPGHIVALLGESGCGKTTILRMIAGFETPDTGSIWLNGKNVAGEGQFVEPQQRQVGIVFQDYALFPHKTVWENIRFGLFRIPGRQAEERIAEIMALSGLQGLEKRYPHQLSGGQKQRVALARALAPQPQLILFDEPFSNIDSMRKTQMREDISQIIRKTSATAIFVTHDTKDVMTIADQVVVMQKGKALQWGTPQQIYSQPVNEYVSDFFGRSNFLKARTEKDGLHTPIGFFPASIPEQDVGKEVIISIRPEEISLQSSGEGCSCGTIVKEKFLGEYKELTCRIESSGESSEIIIYAPPTSSCNPQQCFFKPNPEKINILKK